MWNGRPSGRQGPIAPIHAIVEGMRFLKICPLNQLVVPLHRSFERARQSRLLSMLTHRPGAKGDALHIYVPGHFEQMHMFLEGCHFWCSECVGEPGAVKCLDGIVDTHVLSKFATCDPSAERSDVFSEASVQALAVTARISDESISVTHVSVSRELSSLRAA